MAILPEKPRTIEYTSQAAPVASGKTIFKFPKLGRYHALYFFAETSAGADTSLYAQVDEIKLFINNKVQREHTPAQLGFLNVSRGRLSPVGLTGNNNMVTMFFSEPQRRTFDQQTATALTMGRNSDNTPSVRDFKVELTMASGMTAGTVIKCYALVDSGFDDELGQTPALGQMVKYIRQTENIASVGLHEIKDLPLNRGAYYGVYAFEDGTSTLDQFSLKADNTQIHDLISNDRFAQIFQTFNPDLLQGEDANGFEDPDGDALIVNPAHAYQFDTFQSSLQALGVGNLSNLKAEVNVSVGTTSFEVISELVGFAD